MVKERSYVRIKLLRMCMEKNCNLEMLLTMHFQGEFHLGRSYYLQCQKMIREKNKRALLKKKESQEAHCHV